MWSVVGWGPQALLRPCVSESEGGPERGGAKTARFRWAGGDAGYRDYFEL